MSLAFYGGIKGDVNFWVRQQKYVITTPFY